VHPLKDAFGHSFGIVGRCNVLQEDHKLIATEPGDRIDTAYTAFKVDRIDVIK
jgi:hypothetical protein